MRPALPVVVLLTGCLGEGRQAVSVPLVFDGDVGPSGVGVRYQVDRAELGVGDLELIAPSGRVIGDWPDAAPANLVDLVPLGQVDALEGVVAQARLRLTAEPPLRLSGTTTRTDDVVVPFDLTVASPVPVRSVDAAFTLDRHDLPSQLVLTLDLAVVLDAFDWALDPGVDRRLDMADGIATALVDAIEQPGAWRVAPSD